MATKPGRKAGNNVVEERHPALKALKLRGTLKLVFEPLFLAPLLPMSSVRAEVVSYLASVHKRAAHVEFVDTSTADGISQGLTALIDSVGDSAPEEHRRLIHGAARYFILEDDEDGDLSSPTGFDDDAEVFNAVAEYLGRADLKVKL